MGTEKVSARINISLSATAIKGVADKSVVHNRRAFNPGQLRKVETLRVNSIAQNELLERYSKAVKLITMGECGKPKQLDPEIKQPKELSGVSQLSKAKGDLTKANNKLKKANERIAFLENEISELKKSK